MRLHLQSLIGERFQPSCFDMDNIILDLQDTAGQNELATHHRRPVPFIDIDHDDEVGESSFILQRHKGDSVGCSRTLPRCDATSNEYELSITPLCKIGRRKHVLFSKRLSTVRHWMLSDRKAGA